MCGLYISTTLPLGWCFFLLMFLVCAAEHRPKLLLISFDGFRWDYLDKIDTPNFDKITNNGVKAKWIKDSFTSLTFPNHYTIVTGLYEESHGIIANTFYDPVFKETFNIGNKTTVQDGKFWGGEPIWVTNQLQGGRTGVYYWVGSEAEIKGVRPTHYEIYVQGRDATLELWKNRTDTVIQWLTDPDNVVDLALLYFKEPDHTGHLYGPDSPEVLKIIKQCDDIIGYLLEQLQEHGLIDMLNIIITSDHGMTSMNRSQFITLDDHIDVNQTAHLLNYVVGTSVWPQKGENITEELYNNLSAISEHVSTWMKKDIPPEYHYADNRRVSPILMSADLGWGIKKNWDKDWYLLGRHGFNNSEMDMHPFFVARGPMFKKNYVSEPFENIHIYELMCHILGVNPAPNNGSLESVKQLLEDEFIVADDTPNNEDHIMIAKWTGVCLGLIVMVSLLIYIVKEFSPHRIKAMRKRMRLDVSNTQYDELEDHKLLLNPV